LIVEACEGKVNNLAIWLDNFPSKNPELSSRRKQEAKFLNIVPA
jgi:hypothetical protein